MTSETVRYRVTGMDCTDCVAKIEKTARKVPGVDSVRVSLTSQVMTLQLVDGMEPLPRLEEEITELGYRLDRMDARDDASDTLPPASYLTPAYKRALVIVVVLNFGYGLIEAGGGYLSDSQALKADALDFLGDGLITFLGLLAIAWRPIWRARSALIQGIFLGALGLTVLGATIYRVIVQKQPEAELMGAFGLVALVINVTAALVLLPHRAGDANARAVWLFSRNDALGNVAVVIAAILVAWLASPWPDLVVAFIIAGLFLQSSWSIIKDAHMELLATGGA
ncbi:MAG: cation transporter [Thermomicrobiales bacterium]